MEEFLQILKYKMGRLKIVQKICYWMMNDYYIFDYVYDKVS